MKLDKGNTQLLRGSIPCFALWFVLFTFGALFSFAQSAGTPANLPTMEEYKIGPGDVLTVTVADAPEFSGKFRVTDTGLVEISGTNGPLQAQGLTPLELSAAIHKALVDSKQLRDPRVSVFIEEYHGRTITVLGSVSKPGVYTLNRRTTVLDALSLAGGPLPNSGNTVTVVRGAASAEATGELEGSVKIIDMSHLTRGDAPLENVDVRNGDVVNVSATDVVYVVGAVTKPGGFVMSNPSAGVSAVQAVALAEGLTRIASGHKGVIVRQSTSQEGRKEIEVDIYQMMAGKQADVLLAPNDILFVPESNTKKTLKVMGDIAMAAINGVAIYGLGYRVGNGNL
jgi:polysaccharide export outer membrane protein